VGISGALEKSMPPVLPMLLCPGTGALRRWTFQTDFWNSPIRLDFQVARLSGLEEKNFWASASNASCAPCPCQQPGPAPAGLMQQIFVAASL
jgi:hypothetical protein